MNMATVVGWVTAPRVLPAWASSLTHSKGVQHPTLQNTASGSHLHTFAPTAASAGSVLIFTLDQLEPRLSQEAFPCSPLSPDPVAWAPASAVSVSNPNTYDTSGCMGRWVSGLLCLTLVFVK